MVGETTPIRQQYLRIKQQYPEAIVFFRLGDFYETFDEDARVTSRELEIVLTAREMGRGNKVPMAGIPHHALDNYLGRLISRGYRVAICEQVTKPGETRGIVEREVVRLVTPGTVVEPGLLQSNTNNYLASLIVREDTAGLAWVDITTSEFFTEQIAASEVLSELTRLRPTEIITVKGTELTGIANGVSVTELEGYHFEAEVASAALLRHFGAATLEAYGCARFPLATGAAGAIIHYIAEAQKAALGQITRLATVTSGNFMVLDAQTQRNLELFRAGRAETGEGSLLSALDRTRTPAGGRLLRKWLGQPLLDINILNQRLDGVGWFVARANTCEEVMARLGDVADLERIINRVRSQIALPRELVTLRRSLEAVPKLRQLIEGEEGCGAISWLLEKLQPRPDITELIDEAILEEPAAGPGDGDVICPGLSEELDSVRLAAGNARSYIASLEAKERQRSGIKSLKIGYNNVFGYYIEVSRANLGQVPEDYIRKQTLTGGERFFTPELKEYESLILNARQRIEELQAELFGRVCRQIATAAERILELAGAIAQLDTLAGLADVARHHNYCRPEISEGTETAISGGRHPVVERSLPAGTFQPNDTQLSGDDVQIIVLTGPNMSGKSTYLRQVALITLMAQIGGYVPADSAVVSLCDRIFTRIGAREDLGAGQSTFMVEMVETAAILNNATPRSLIILDEVGRGTSTYDGLSIARAVTEYLHNQAALRAKTLFATHYHEMVELAGYLGRVKNFNVSVVEDGGRVVFLHRIVPGGADRSYGIHVAELAGLPRSVVKRAREVLGELESGHRAPAEPPRRRRRKVVQYSLFGEKPEVLKELEALDLNGLSPMEALTRLYEIQQKLKGQD